MARKPKVQARDKTPREPAGSKKPIYQCLHCGALTDPIYGVGEVSWCPSCGNAGDIVYDIGKIPDPMFYGGWLTRHKQELAAGKADGAMPVVMPAPVPIRPTKPGGMSMKVTTLHSGIYHCPECCMEFDLDEEESIKCDSCNGLLMKGSLEDLDEEPEEDE